MFYLQHYHMAISKHLTREQKVSVAKRISELTLHEPIWQDRVTDYSEQFPELAPHINVRLSGLYLTAIIKGIVEDLGLIGGEGDGK